MTSATVGSADPAIDSTHVATVPGQDGYVSSLRKQEIEATLQTMGEVEVSSRIVGDMVIKGLKEMDHVAYIRYAIVYLGLDDLKSIRNEIDQLLES